MDLRYERSAPLAGGARGVQRGKTLWFEPRRRRKTCSHIHTYHNIICVRQRWNGAIMRVQMTRTRIHIHYAYNV